ncbi:alpha/beta hydrolase [Muricoccus pecuniae]|uniref:Acetyl esterase/lipase n=1 Tax=Muricoccus pecuniae TaxID=693023 RepID=A0A840YHK1_9PROT|nr:alpha/beta hydrolase [Roseomonas pecuniae]MBB5694002.1 acetyl esterase/lipase [Roseomonas pecuniae]
MRSGTLFPAPTRAALLAIALLALGLTGAGGAHAVAPADGQEIPLWPADPPGSARFAAAQEVIERSRDPGIQDRAVLNITRPQLVIFRPERPNGTALLVTPGGAYQRVVIDKEGEEVARRLNRDGITVFRLVYRLPGGGQATDAPLMDAQRAMRLIRHNARDWGLDPQRIGMLGFSAGGHLAAQLATGFERRVYQPQDAADALPARPDFLALGYPVISMDPAITHAVSREELLGKTPLGELVEANSPERHVSKALPPSFIFGASDDDAVPVANALAFYGAAARAGVPAELHLFRQGGHGFSIRLVAGMPAAEWPGLLVNWMRSIRMAP